MFVSTDGRDCLVCYFKVLGEPNEPLHRIKLKGLDPQAQYRWAEHNEAYGGDELMYAGLSLPIMQGDFQSLLVRLQKV
jgi:alpha-galactosidase